MHKLWIITFVFISNIIHAEPNLPKWVTTPVQDSSNSFFTVGSGDSIKNAQANALNQLSMRLIVNVSSETQSYTQLDNGKLKQRLNQSSIQETERLTFVNTKIVSSFASANETFVLVSVDKNSVFKQIIDDIKQNLLPLTVTKSINSGQVLANRFVYDRKRPRYQKYFSLLKVYDVDTHFADDAISAFVDISNQLIQTTSFSIVAPSEDPLSLVKNYSQTLIAKGYSQQEKQHHLKVTIVGPELLYSEQNNHHAYRVNGHIYFSFDENVILTFAINEFHFNKDKSLAWSALNTNLNQVIAQ